MMQGTRRSPGGGPPGIQATRWRGHPPGRVSWPPGWWAPPPGSLFRVYTPYDLKILEGRSDRVFRRRYEAETSREKKTSPAARFCRGKPLPEWEIVIITITGIIETIITIFTNISTISIFIPSHFTIAIRVVSCTIHPLYFTGVDYYFVVDAIKFCWRILGMIRLFIIYLSPLIMISFISCE